MSEGDSEEIPMKAIGEAEKVKTPTKKSPGIMSRFLGLGRALADSVSLIGGETEVTVGSQVERRPMLKPRAQITGC